MLSVIKLAQVVGQTSTITSTVNLVPTNDSCVTTQCKKKPPCHKPARSISTELQLVTVAVR